MYGLNGKEEHEKAWISAGNDLFGVFNVNQPILLRFQRYHVCLSVCLSVSSSCLKCVGTFVPSSALSTQLLYVVFGASN